MTEVDQVLGQVEEADLVLLQVEEVGQGHGVVQGQGQDLPLEVVHHHILPWAVEAVAAHRGHQQLVTKLAQMWKRMKVIKKI